jgi:hypothetical protein
VVAGGRLAAMAVEDIAVEETAERIAVTSVPPTLCAKRTAEDREADLRPVE